MLYIHNSGLSTYERILKEGKKEFLEKGFKDASLRQIVKSAGVTTGAFYGYFPDKNALFEELVTPVVSGLRDMFMTAQTQFDALTPVEKRQAVYDYSSGEVKQFVAYIYEHFDIFKLLISCSSGTAFSDFIHDLVEVEVTYTLKFLDAIDNDTIRSGRGSKELFHIISSAFFSAIFEVVRHDMSREEAEQYTASLREFFSAGWMKLFGL